MVAQVLSPGVKKRRVDRRARREARAFYLFISPWIIGFLVFSLGPIIAAFYFSLTNLHALNIHDGLPQFIGLKNYTNMFADNIFRSTIVATGIWTFGGLAVNTVVGILLAQLLNQRIPGLRFPSEKSQRTRSIGRAARDGQTGGCRRFVHQRDRRAVGIRGRAARPGHGIGDAPDERCAPHPRAGLPRHARFHLGDRVDRPRGRGRPARHGERGEQRQ